MQADVIKRVFKSFVVLLRRIDGFRMILKSYETRDHREYISLYIWTSYPKKEPTSLFPDALNAFKMQSFLTEYPTIIS